MKPFRFDHSMEDGLHVWRYLDLDGGPLEGGCYVDFDWPDDKPVPGNVAYATRESAAAYLGFAWRLAAPRFVFALPRWYRELTSDYLGREPELVNWEYDIADEEGDDPGALRGFVRSRSSTPAPPHPLGWDVAHPPAAGLWSISSLEELLAAHRATLGDSSGETNLYCRADGDRDLLVWALRDREQPSLPAVLGPDDVFVDVVVGDDLGYADAVVVQAHADLSVRVDALAADYERALYRYEAALPEIRTIPEFLERLDRLARAA